MPDPNLEIKYTQAAITPFWRKLPFFFLFPFRFGPLIFLVCIVAASTLAGVALGGFSIVFKGFLAYLGLRYAFNVLELFAKGRFEGESMDHRLWGPEKRPAKLGLVITLFIVLVVNVGSFGVGNRIAYDDKAQDLLVAQYKADHAAELAALERERDAYNKAVAAQAAAAAARPKPVEAYSAASSDDEDGGGAASSAPSAESLAFAQPELVPPEAGPTRAQMIESFRPQAGDALWLRLLPGWFWPLVIALSLLLPAAAVVIALEDNLLRALNPLNVVTLISAMGSAYFVLWAFFLAIAGSRQLVLTAGAGLPAFVRFPIEMGVATYLALVLFALMGYALYQFHQELHLDVDVDFDDHRAAGGAEAIATAGSARQALQQAQGPVDPLEAKVRALLAAGNVKEAIAEVKDHMRYDRMDPQLNTRLHELYAQGGERETTLTHGQQWLTALVRAGQGREAFLALGKLRALEPTFEPEDGDVILPLATAAMRMREFDVAAGLLRGFDRRHPKHKDTPAVFFLGARLLSEQSRQHEKAAQILRAVLAHFPDHDIAAEARTYLEVLEAVLAKAPVTQ